MEGRKNAVEIELKERLQRRREEFRLKLEALEEPEDDSSSGNDLEARTRELKVLNSSIDSMGKKLQCEFIHDLLPLCEFEYLPSWTATEKEGEELTAQVQELRSALEKIHSQQTEDSRSISKQQKTTERYLAKRQMLTSRKDECNRNIRDLGVLPEEAFEKYVNEKLERVGSLF